MRYNPRYGYFRALLRKTREDAGLSQSALAGILGRPQTYVSKVELGERKMDFFETVDFCAACKVALPKFWRQLQKRIPRKESPRKKRRSPRKMDSAGRLSS